MSGGGSTGTQLETIERRVVRCRLCPRLVEHREAIGRVKRRAFHDQEYWARPLPSFGDPRARLLIVGLAPAAHGANRTGRMFTGDRSGEWLYRALHSAGFSNMASSRGPGDGLELRNAYITAALHCAPPHNKPSSDELATCRRYLEQELVVFKGQSPGSTLVVLALGGIAFEACLRSLVALGHSLPRPRPRFGHMAEHRFDHSLVLLASYHPSQQNTQTGRLTRAMLDRVFKRARRLASG